MLIKNTYTKIFFGLYILFTLYACESFVEVDVPNDRIIGGTVFDNEQTALSALEGMYSQLFNTNFAAGGNRSVTFLSGLSGDNFSLTATEEEMVEFAENEIFPSNSFNLNVWTGAYSTIYMANALMEGVESSQSLSEPISNRILGEAKFVRAFTYFYLVNLYRSVPLILTTDYNSNALATNANTEEINAQIINDLSKALEEVGTVYPDNERTYAISNTVKALLARVFLFQENWEQAENYSSQVIDSGDLYALIEDPDQVFLANSREAIWQISPAGWGGTFQHTREGNLFVRISSTNSPVEVSDDFLEIWDNNDKRFENWISNYSDETGDYKFPNKYKVQYDVSGGEFTEYSMVMRLAEQYLIRAEARTRLGNLSGAIADLDVIKKRAGIALISETDPAILEDQLLEFILLEKRKELFGEWGHRWLDLKRTGSADEILGGIKPLWESTDIFYPIPEQERMKNPNLEQNEGY